MGDARRQQDLADRAVQGAKRALAGGDQPAAVAALRTALRYRPMDKLQLTPALRELWDSRPLDDGGAHSHG